MILTQFQPNKSTSTILRVTMFAMSHEYDLNFFKLIFSVMGQSYVDVLNLRSTWNNSIRYIDLRFVALRHPSFLALMESDYHIWKSQLSRLWPFTTDGDSQCSSLDMVGSSFSLSPKLTWPGLKPNDKFCRVEGVPHFQLYFDSK